MHTPILPQEPEIERIILGAAMLRDDPKQIDQIRREVEPGAFTVPFNREAWLAICAIVDRPDESVDPMTLWKEMESRGSTYKDLPLRIAELTNGVPPLSNLKGEIRKLKEVFTRREVMRCAEAWMNEAQARDVDVQAFVRSIGKRADDFQELCASEHDPLDLEPGFYLSLQDLHEKQTEPADYVLLGVRRRQVSLFLSVTNVGKSTTLLNHCLAAAAKKSFMPLLPEAPERPLKVIYIDGESTDDELKNDTLTMLRSIGGKDDAIVNFIPVVEATIGDDALDLSDKKHFAYIKNFVKAQQPDILVIDTIGSLFTLFNENDNAEVKRKVIRPLRELAKAGNCGVIGSHHIGKRGENTADEEEAHLGRGASAFGTDTRAVFTLKREKAMGDGYVRLSLPKAKGVKFEPTVLKLDFAARTFEICTAAPKVATPYEQVIGVFNGKPLRTADIKKLLPKLSGRLVEQELKLAVHTGDLLKPSQGIYEKPLSNQLPHVPHTPIGPAERAEVVQPIEDIEDTLDWSDDAENEACGSFEAPWDNDEPIH